MLVRNGARRPASTHLASAPVHNGLYITPATAIAHFGAAQAMDEASGFCGALAAAALMANSARLLSGAPHGLRYIGHWGLVGAMRPQPAC